MVEIRFDKSQPKVENVSLPASVPTGNEFTVSVEIANESTVVVPQTGTCQSGIAGTNVAWLTPVELVVDGEVRETKKLCLDGSSGTKTHEFRLRLNEEGSHTVEVRAIREPQNEVGDEWSQTVTVEDTARDPAAPSPFRPITEWLGTAGESGKNLLILAAIAFGVFMLV